MKAATNPRILRTIPVLIVVCSLCAVQSAFAAPIVGWGGQVVAVDLSEGFVAVAAGEHHSLGLKEDGSLATYGKKEADRPQDSLWGFPLDPTVGQEKNPERAEKN